ncbi:hypothetical protein ILUMI_09587 [Ignelater luminosus]|uniref:Kinetochore protein SPC25 n=1 Tax=Ignelater luminosus TaxID=2038154 RepID=A0A8K0CZG6_IGNLU|nr:hypothetical protein ILUMI_09587 [Ignelater luminosus]
MKVQNDIIHLQPNEFLIDPEKELHSHASISEKNYKAIESHKESILCDIKNALGVSSQCNDLFHKFLQVKYENVKSKYLDHEQKMQINSLVGAIQKKKKSVENLEKELKDLEFKYEKLKNEIKHEEKENQMSAELFHKAVKYFTTYFQYIIEEIHSDEDNYTVKINFIIEGKLSQHPIRFIFDSKIDTLINFHAGALLTTQQHDILFNRFKETHNLPALFFTLRYSALQKHVK